MAHDKGQCVITDQSGNLYVTGYFNSPTITFDSITLNNNTVNFKADIFLAKYSPSGNLLWVKSAGGTNNDLALSCTIDPNGNVIIAGYYSSPVLTIGGFQLNNAGYDDIFIAEFNSGGSVLWAKSFGGALEDLCFSVSCDSIGTAYIAGYFQSSDIIFDNDTLHNTGALDFYVARFGINVGGVSWARSATGTDNDIAYSVAADASGNAYVAGYYFSPTLNFGTTSASNQGGYDIFVCKYDVSGNLQWMNDAGGTSSDVSRSIAVDFSGNVYLTGYFGDVLTFGNTTLTASATDFFLAAFDNSGNDRWATSGGAAYGEEGTGVCTDYNGNVYISGTFESPSITIGNTTLTNAGSFIEDSYIAGYDNNGNNLWAKGIGGADVDIANAVCTDGSANLFTTGFYGSSTISFDAITLTNIAGAPYQDVFTAKLSAPVNVSETNFIGKDVHLFPNPATSELTVNSRQYTINTVDISDLTGRNVYRLKNINSSQSLEINISDLPPDIYFVKIETDKKIFVEKFVKQ